MLIKEKEATAMKDGKQVMKLFESIPGIRSSSAALCVKNTYVRIGEHGPEDSSDLICTPEQAKQAQMDLQLVRNFFSALPLFENPDRTLPPHLRAVYNEIQSLSHCPGMEGVSKSFPSTVKLIYFKKIVKNFLAYYKNDIARYNRDLKTKNGFQSLEFPDLSDPNLSRAQILQKIANFKMMGFLSFDPHSRKLADAAETMLVQMKGYDNAHWIEYPEKLENLRKGISNADLWSIY